MKVDMFLKNKIDRIFNNKCSDIYPQIPRTILIEVTNKCNSKCIFCANHKMNRERNEIDFNLLCDILLQAYENGVREVGFYTTGEPLLYSKIVDAVKFAKKIGYDYVYITSNGINANISIMNKLINCGLDSIKFSINAINKNDYKLIHGIDYFDNVISNLKATNDLRNKIDSKLKIFVSYIATSYTDYDITTIKNFFSDYCDDVSIVNVRNQSGMMPLEFNFLKCKNESNKVQSSRVLPCHYLFNVINVSYEGYLTGCCTDFQNYLAFADLKKEKLIDAWNNKIITDLRKQHICGCLKNNMCYNCINGSKSMPEPLCKELYTYMTNKELCDLSEFNRRVKKER